MIKINELNMNEGLKFIGNSEEKYFKTIYEDSIHETKKVIRNEAGEIIYYDVIAEDTYKNKRYEVQVKESEAKCNDLLKDDLPADFIYSNKCSEVLFVS